MKHLFLIVFLVSSIWFLLEASDSCFELQKPKRVEVPDELVDWNEPFPSYNPLIWVSPCLHDFCDSNFTQSIKFNKKDGTVDRRMARRAYFRSPKYKVTDGVPLNPLGRTGLTGRGYLPRWGPNHLVIVVLVRKIDGRTAYLKTHEELAFTDDIFATFVDNVKVNKFSKKVVAAVKKSSLFHEKADMAEEVLRKAGKRAVKVAADTMPSPFDTDNAWIELSVYVISCRRCARFCVAVMQDSEIARNYNWSHRLDRQSFREVPGTFQESKVGTIGNYLRHDTTAKRSGWKIISFIFKREMLFAYATVAAYATGAGLLIAGFSTAGLSIIIGTVIVGVLFAIINFSLPCKF